MKTRHVLDFDDRAGELAQRLRHQAGLEADLRVAHLALDFGARHQRRHRVDHDDVDRVGAHQHLDDLERLLAVVGLRHQQVVDVDPELLGVFRVERVFGVDERRHAAGPLRLGDHLQRERGLARRFRPEHLDDAAAREAADAQGVVDADRPGGDGVAPAGRRPSGPRRMMAPLPNCFSIWPTAISMALSRSFASSTGMMNLRRRLGWLPPGAAGRHRSTDQMLTGGQAKVKRNT